MDEEEALKMTRLDAAISTRDLQIMKAMVPYVHLPEQRMFAVFLKLRELMDTMAYFSDFNKDLKAAGLQEDGSDFTAMLNDIKPFFSKEEQSSLDMMMNMMQASKLYETFQSTMNAGEESDSGDPMSMLKNFLTPEQQEMFNNYSNLF